MREIKFRAKTNDGVQWVHGSLINASPDKPVLIEEYDGLRRISSQYLVDPATVGQFTGLLDSNGKEIYEGDIVRVDSYGEESIHKVVYGDYWHYPAFDLDPYLDCESNGLSYCMADTETTITVIGNVHDNPALLAEK